jgi:hypothetical protein
MRRMNAFECMFVRMYTINVKRKTHYFPYGFELKHIFYIFKVKEKVVQKCK